MKKFKYSAPYYDLIYPFVFPENEELWNVCPVCGLKPKVWEFDNGRQTGCGCHNSKYDHRVVTAESIMSVISRCNGSAKEYDSDELRKNWNYFCETGEEIKLSEGKW